ncbi:MAG: GNAT family N-acetyltransferase [Acidobacteria bacterium]|nr:GNAT family N-acetyltransferase [Acidobacteriota bacterium]
MLPPITLEGRYVRLEPLTEDHLDGLCAIGFEPALWALTTVRVTNREEMAEYIRAAQGPGQHAFAVIEKAGGKVAGSTRFMNYEPAHKRVEIGSTWYGQPFQRTAVNTECKYLLFRHGFETMGMNRVELKTDSRNTRSQRAMLRVGAKEEGTLRRHMVVPGHVRDTVYFSVIVEEWPEVKARLEKMLEPRG